MRYLKTYIKYRYYTQCEPRRATHDQISLTMIFR